MWITMKTHNIQNEEDIDEILLNNMNEFNNVFELNKKSILQSNKKTTPGMDFILLETNLTSLQIQKKNSSKSILRKNSKMYYVSCIDIKNKKGECFSSLIDNLSENDRIVIINAVVLKQFTMSNSNKLTVVVRSQNNSSVILFKCRNLLEKSISVSEKNFSSLTGSGVYSIYGIVKKILRYYNEDLISLRLLSPDKSSLKTLKYFHFNSGYKNIINNKTASGLKYDFLSNKVDILVKTPSKDFTSLSLNQRICLNNVTVENINDSDIFLLHMNGNSHNIKAVPIDIKTIRPPRLLIPDELKPEILPKFKKLSDDVQLASNKTVRELNKNITALKKTLNVQQSKHRKIKCIELSDDDDDDDIVNLSPCRDFSTSTQIIKKSNYVHNNASSFGKNKVNIIDDNALPIKHLRSDDKVQKYNDNSLLTTSNKDTSLPKSKICPQRDISPSSYSDGSCSPSFFVSQPKSLILNQDDKVQKYNDNSSLTTSNKDNSLPKSKIYSQRDISPSSSSGSSCSPSFINSQPESLILNQDARANNFESNTVSQPTQCIGPCRLIHIVPNVFDSNEIVSGYCMKCNAFVQKCYLKLTPQSSNMEYKCPKCSTIVQLTFFFIMNFLYGKNESQAIEVCCYDKKAESVVRKISKKKIKLEDYLSDQNNKQLVISSMKSLINNRTKVNIVVCFSPEDNKNILLGIDMKYVVTTPIQ
ncbi:uncharacterized protein LOC100164102 [Acyrthosiphon pisum]|uniref:Uncharacterized protein n=1 Tax=Acyrthosiphon pisum TaxID=7029 RepID=A0A8R1W1A0_ACYPI|nr:uncharacterized protein LOC100164102 [Acyrthosiphon pisum]|eukprot:XP_001944850.1 PREDICTED: uncharacterized protein LOC100164102 [Acyrthosiphon pisum]